MRLIMFGFDRVQNLIMSLFSSYLSQKRKQKRLYKNYIFHLYRQTTNITPTFVGFLQKKEVRIDSLSRHIHLNFFKLLKNYKGAPTTTTVWQKCFKNVQTTTVNECDHIVEK